LIFSEYLVGMAVSPKTSLRLPGHVEKVNSLRRERANERPARKRAHMGVVDRLRGFAHAKRTSGSEADAVLAV
jgi:hypothetical protein